ncbi:site-specific recombinase, phage integrase family protein [Toxoplasma gondii ME49]|uniref:Site-specific recombinase, phage integrase family protein n=2 Tax=Toxoplasma gondii TaxID=5811 RepID=A0A125YW46_TOXGV|nr:site-specific recombinase, phage integrase family protein [Toxoplasma gondii ME49]EPT29425.1 site-specific recombinase, phage integrase family protein [Toxoplasma gondii ME49]ESS32153.1 site-specific recombinase, phage integrase family protein [Toxoplasma gondii VEG]|eukprot:XP_018637044.1 site-specific recombinase, phage integrase family protein [Toxoplasma gondii ME49]
MCRLGGRPRLLVPLSSLLSLPSTFFCSAALWCFLLLLLLFSYPVSSHRSRATSPSSPIARASHFSSASLPAPPDSSCFLASLPIPLPTDSSLGFWSSSSEAAAPPLFLFPREPRGNNGEYNSESFLPPPAPGGIFSASTASPSSALPSSCSSRPCVYFSRTKVTSFPSFCPPTNTSNGHFPECTSSSTSFRAFSELFRHKQAQGSDALPCFSLLCFLAPRGLALFPEHSPVFSSRRLPQKRLVTYTHQRRQFNSSPTVSDFFCTSRSPSSFPTYVSSFAFHTLPRDARPSRLAGCPSTSAPCQQRSAAQVSVHSGPNAWRVDGRETAMSLLERSRRGGPSSRRSTGCCASAGSQLEELGDPSEEREVPKRRKRKAMQNEGASASAAWSPPCEAEGRAEETGATTKGRRVKKGAAEREDEEAHTNAAKAPLGSPARRQSDRDRGERGESKYVRAGKGEPLEEETVCGGAAQNTPLAELREACRKIHISSKGTKEEILSRLANAMRGVETPEEEVRVGRRGGGCTEREKNRRTPEAETDTRGDGGERTHKKAADDGSPLEAEQLREATRKQATRVTEDEEQIEEERSAQRPPRGERIETARKKEGESMEEGGDDSRRGRREGWERGDEVKHGEREVLEEGEEKHRKSKRRSGDNGEASSTKRRQRSIQEEDIEGGTERQPTRCGECGKRMNKRAKFCGGCGAPAGAAARETLRVFIEKHFLPIREQEVGEHTRRVERGFWKSILEVLGDVAVSELSGVHWERYLKILKKRNCSPRTQALHQVAYQAALRYGVHTGRLSRSHDFRRIRGCTKRTMQSEPLRATEVPRLLDAAGSAMHRSMFAVGIGIGLRPSELLRLHWEDIDWKNNIASIRGSKTAASRAAVPLTDLARRELFSWWEEEGSPATGLCFYAEGARRSLPNKREEGNGETEVTGKKTKSPMRSFKKALHAAAKRAALETTPDGERRRIFPYLLRHSFATLAATSNPPVPLPVAQAVMRHTSSKMLLDTYAKAGTLVIKEGLKNFNV